MELLCIGLNYSTASIEIRERVSVSASKLGEQSAAFQHIDGVEGAVVLSTCNRTEIYASVSEASTIAPSLIDFLAKEFQLSETDLTHFYKYERREVIEHLCGVVSGLDSMVLGETEIFGQVKKAYTSALGIGSTERVINQLFQKSFGIGKKIRTNTSIQQGQTSIGSVAVDLAEKIFGNLKKSKVMVIGAGEMSRTTAQSLQSRGAHTIFVTNRNFERAIDLAKELNGHAVTFDDWEDTLKEVDVVISSTGAPHPVITPKHIEPVRRHRKYRPLFFIDIAVPRDVDPAVQEIEEVYRYDIDGLEKLAAEGVQKRHAVVQECEQIIRDAIDELQIDY